MTSNIMRLTTAFESPIYTNAPIRQQVDDRHCILVALTVLLSENLHLWLQVTHATTIAAGSFASPIDVSSPDPSCTLPFSQQHLPGTAQHVLPQCKGNIMQGILTRMYEMKASVPMTVGVPESSHAHM